MHLHPANPNTELEPITPIAEADAKPPEIQGNGQPVAKPIRRYFSRAFVVVLGILAGLVIAGLLIGFGC